MSFSKSENITDLAGALSQAQILIEKAAKDKVNPYFKSLYADLGNIMDVIKPAISKHGLSFIQICNEKQEYASISTIILHSSGQWVNCGEVSVPVNKKDAQAFGSALTYARRYSLSSAFGVASDDDDGNHASKGQEQKNKNIAEKKQTRVDGPEKASLEKISQFEFLCEQLEISSDKIQERLTKNKIKSLADMSSYTLDKWINELLEKKSTAYSTLQQDTL